ncbi:hypothetical protein ACLOJK_023641 [Asimina triloba]
MEEESSSNRTLSAQLLRTGSTPESPRPTAIALFINRATGGRRGPSMLVRETAALHLEERRADWGYSKPVVALDIAWNLAFTLVSVIMLASTLNEEPNTPIRLWIAGYALQCVVHVVLVWFEYRRRNSRRRRSLEEGSGAGRSSDSEGIDSDDEEGEGVSGNRSRLVDCRVDLFACRLLVEKGKSLQGEISACKLKGGDPYPENHREVLAIYLIIAKRCESVNTMASFFWWIVGFYWVVSGGETLLQTAPRLYWATPPPPSSKSAATPPPPPPPPPSSGGFQLNVGFELTDIPLGNLYLASLKGHFLDLSEKVRLSVVFLAFDVFFAIFCVALACVIGIALCCCLPCIIAILYAVAGQDGASDADISLLSRYRFNQSCGDEEKATNGGGVMIAIGSSGDTSNERVLLSEDAECCICLTAYEDGAELNELPCGHHFHSSCIIRWLRINATCPLCKYNILKGNDQV